MNEHYPFTLLPLPYAYNALEPYIDEETMRVHHDKHVGAYVDNLNKALEKYPEFHSWSLDKLLYNIASLPEEIQTKVRNNGGGVFNHNLYFSVLGPDRGTYPEGNFMNAVNKEFGSLDNFLKILKEKALSVFGSGYAYVVLNRNGKLMIITTKNQDTPLEQNLYPVLPVDVWEHAYYLKHQNRRADYIEDLFKVINWKRVEAVYNNFFNYNT